MAIQCKNCAHRVEGHYCSQCGQDAATHRLTSHFIWHELQHGLLHVDRGILYTSAQLLRQPGQTIRDFINGKRVRHFKPIAFIVVYATVYGLLFHYFIDTAHTVNRITSHQNVVSAYETVIEWITHHFAYATLLLIVNTTLASKLVFRKQGYNFTEHLVLNTYYRGLVLFVNLLFLPILARFPDLLHSGLYPLIAQLADLCLMIWCYTQFFNRLPNGKTVLLVLLVYLIMSAINIGIGYALGWSIGHLSHK